MSKTIVIIGTLDTKGEEYAFIKKRIESHGFRTLLVDVGVLGQPTLMPDITAEQVAEAAGTTLQRLADRRDRGSALDTMTEGAAIIAQRLHGEGRVDGIISMGGSGGTALGTSAMRALPMGIPKVMVSTVASGDTSPYVGITNITMMPSIVDVAGLNRVSRRIFTQAADAICGMVAGDAAVEATADQPAIATSMFGNTTKAVDKARALLVDQGFETLVFHATGTGGKTMEMLIEDGYFNAVLDMTITELVDEVCGGVLSAGPNRLESAAKTGVPQVVAPGCLDMCNFWAAETVPERYRDRKLHHWTPNVTLMRTTPEENIRLGEMVAQKLNEATGPVAVLIPTQGFSELDAPGQPFWWPQANDAFVKSLQKTLRPNIPVTMIDHNINDPEFATAMVNSLLHMMREEDAHGTHPR